ncbi:MAG: hypothetical protein J7K84_11985 [Deltaproteobacteria bacterium]|nr:hypothetical protein [Deltaproteobacteria bacterium]
MISTVKQQVSMDDAKDRLINFAINRDDLKDFLQILPDEKEINPVKIEYEAQILKIISVGWGISLFLPESSQKNELTESFWNAVNEFSVSISMAASSIAGKEIDYFSILKDRLDQYVAVSGRSKGADIEPISIIPPEFARICGNKDNIHVIMIGNRIFSSVIGGVKEYILSVEIKNGKNR